MDTLNIFENVENNNVYKDELNLTLDHDTNISLYNTNLKKISITICDNTKVDINDFNSKSKGKRTIIFNIKSNASINYNLSNIVNDNYNLEIKINYLGTKSLVETNIHSMVKGISSVKIDGNIKNEFKDNELLENVKVMLIEEGKCEVVPNMLIDTNQVIANHKVAISNIRNDELFYLMSKGISENSSINLIKKSFLISNIKNKDLINKINDL